MSDCVICGAHCEGKRVVCYLLDSPDCFKEYNRRRQAPKKPKKHYLEDLKLESS